VSNITSQGSETAVSSEASLANTPQSRGLVARLDALPISRWHLKARGLVGSATFFDGVDSVAIGMVLPVIAQAWGLTPQEIGWLISGGFLGQMIGAVGFGFLAEKIGRIPTLMLTTAVFAVGGIASAFAWGFGSMFVLRTLQGLGLGAEVPVAATYINEIAPADKRGRFVLLYEFIFVVGLVAAGFLGRFVVPTWGWQAFVLLGSVPPLLVLLFLRTLPESPRWLVRKGRLAQAEKAIGIIEASVLNGGKTIPPARLQLIKPDAGSGHWTELFSKQYRARTFMIWLVWLTIGFISWPLLIWMPTIYRTVFKIPLEQALNYGVANNIVLLAAGLACALLIDFTGRKAWFSGAFLVAGAALVTIGLSGALNVDTVFLCTAITLFGITSLNLGIYLYTPELYPTRMRALGVGVALAWARVGGMIAPPIIGWGMANDGLPAVFMGLGILSVITAIIVFLLAVETSGRVLEEVSP
jgi:putative MFS transporter